MAMHDPYAWPLDFESLLFVPALALAYVFVVRRYGASRLQITCFTAGLALILAVFVTPLHPIALHYLLSIHLLQNVVLAEWAPALCVIGLPAACLLYTSDAADERSSVDLGGRRII